jgi:orotate phosphoribosyltransferase
MSTSDRDRKPATDGDGQGDRQREQDVRALLPARRGHFALESGHHGALWLDLELLCLRPAAIEPLAGVLAARLKQHDVQMVCGPLVEGAFVALMVAWALDVPFTYTDRVVDPATADASGLFPVRYVVPPALRPHLAGQRVAIVNDVVNAGSAVRGTLSDLAACGAEVVAVAALATLGDSAFTLAEAAGVPLETLARLPGDVWAPTACPLCAAGAPLERGPDGETLSWRLGV